MAAPVAVPAAAAAAADPAAGDYIPVIFDDDSSCIVIGDSEYYYPSKDTIATVGQLCAFLEARVFPLSIESKWVDRLPDSLSLSLFSISPMPFFSEPLQAQEDFAGKVIQPLSSRARKIGSREAKSSTVSFIKIEERDAASAAAPGASLALSLPLTQDLLQCRPL